MSRARRSITIAVAVSVSFVGIYLFQADHGPWGEAEKTMLPGGQNGEGQYAMRYVPPNITKEDPAPLVVVLHTWGGDYRQSSGARYLPLVRDRGWFLLHPDFRGPNRTPDSAASDMSIEDLIKAIDATVAQYPINEDAIFLVGASGGGMMALRTAAVHTERFAAVAAWVPITDMTQWHGDLTRLGLAERVKILEGVFGGPPGPDNEAKYQKRSPLPHLDALRDVPVLLAAGTKDGHHGAPVPVRHTLLAFNKLATANGDNGLLLKEDEIHTICEIAGVPDSLRFTGKRVLPLGKSIVLQRQSGLATLWLFDGGHEDDPEASILWFEEKLKGAPDPDTRQ